MGAYEIGLIDKDGNVDKKEKKNSNLPWTEEWIYLLTGHHLFDWL